MLLPDDISDLAGRTIHFSKKQVFEDFFHFKISCYFKFSSVSPRALSLLCLRSNNKETLKPNASTIRELENCAQDVHGGVGFRTELLIQFSPRPIPFSFWEDDASPKQLNS